MVRLLFTLLFCVLATASLAQNVIGSGVVGDVKASASYVGPGDVQAFQNFWSLRCYDNAYTGNMADVWDTATGNTTETLLTCSTNGVINQTVHSLSVTCAVSCSVKTLYDMAGGGENQVWSSVSAAPTVTVSCANSHPCMTFNGSQQLEAASILLNFTATTYGVGERTSSTGTYNQLAGGDSGATFQTGWNNTSGSVFQYNGSAAINITGVAENAFHVFVQEFTDSTSDSFSIDGGTASTGTNTGPYHLAPNGYIIGLASGSTMNGNIVEVGLVQGAISTTVALCHNARLYYGTAGSC